jgi:inosine-uridine nucleoside N-ribohydrolase
MNGSGALLVDVDTGIDDALALALLVNRGANLIAVTTVAGNTPIDGATENTLRVLSLLGAPDIPVHRGASRPLAIPNRVAADVHGDNGLGNIELPVSGRHESSKNGVQAILDLADAHQGGLTVLTLGPLTNLALALNLRPRLIEQICRVIVMGGAYRVPGNTKPHAEFNVLVDPHAADQVFNAGWADLLAIGLDVTHQTALSRRVWQSIPDNGPVAAVLAKRIVTRTFEERGLEGFYLHDPLAALSTLEPDLLHVERGRISVTVDGEELGRTTFTPDASGPVEIATGVDSDRAEQAICRALGIAWSAHGDARNRAE